MFFGSRNPHLRYLRVGLLVVLLVAGTAFHHAGPTYTAIRIVYYALLLGALGFAFSRRSASTHHQSPSGPGPTAPGAPGDPHAPAGPGAPLTSGLAPGWYPDQQNMAVQRYWDGATWTGSRRWDGSNWVPD
jgi:hypothetical protein